MKYDLITTLPCVNTTTSSTTTSSTTTPATTSSTSSSTTSTTTACVDLSLGKVSPSVLSNVQSCYGVFPAGNYRVVYIGGAMKYTAGVGIARFYLNNGPTEGFRVVYSNGLHVIEGPFFDYNGYPTQAEVENHNAGVNVEFYHAGGFICMFLADDYYADNSAGSPSPTFELVRMCGATTTTPATTTGTTTSSTTTSSSTTSSTTTPATTSTSTTTLP